MNLFLRGHGWEPQNLDFVFRHRPGALAGFALGGWAPLGQEVYLQRNHIWIPASALGATPAAPFWGKEGSFGPIPVPKAVMRGDAWRRRAGFGQELLPLTVYRLSLAM